MLFADSHVSKRGSRMVFAFPSWKHLLVLTFAIENRMLKTSELHLISVFFFLFFYSSLCETNKSNSSSENAEINQFFKNPICMELQIKRLLKMNSVLPHFQNDKTNHREEKN